MEPATVFMGSSSTRLWTLSDCTVVYLQAKYIAECIDEIKQELKQENQSVKANAVNKLTYVRAHKCAQSCQSDLRVLVSSDPLSSLDWFFLQLQMLGYDISWASFNIIEVMSCTRFTYKVSSSEN